MYIDNRNTTSHDYLCFALAEKTLPFITAIYPSKIPSLKPSYIFLQSPMIKKNKNNKKKIYDFKTRR